MQIIIMGCKTLSRRREQQCISPSDGILLKIFALLGKDRLWLCAGPAHERLGKGLFAA